MMNYLNCGCGKNFDPNWINIDKHSNDKRVIVYDLNVGIPFGDNYFNVVYHSHVLEHFEQNDAVLFIKECFRVLKPKGILRIVVPDLQRIAEIYLFALKQASLGSEEWIENYEWIMLELYDQTVRDYSGGLMANYLLNNNIKNKKFILERIGKMAQCFFDRSNCVQKNKNKFIFRDWLIEKILGKKEYSALKIGRFRQSGEIHQWMYDFYSLDKLLKRNGFIEIKQKTATESIIQNWIDFRLDIDKDGNTRKPDSLYIEAIKPE